MINILTSAIFVSLFVILTRISFYLFDYIKGMQKPKLLYFNQITFELLVSSVVLGIFVISIFVVHYVVKLIEFINNY